MVWREIRRRPLERMVVMKHSGSPPHRVILAQMYATYLYSECTIFLRSRGILRKVQR